VSDFFPGQNSVTRGPSIALDTLAKVFELAKPQLPTIPAIVLTEAPHLEEYLRTTQANDHLDQTWKLHQIYAIKKATDTIVNLMQQHPMPDPVPQSIWQDVILDKYVNFEKLYAGMD
jgi:hypothetical protein